MWKCSRNNRFLNARNHGEVLPCCSNSTPEQGYTDTAGWWSRRSDSPVNCCAEYVAEIWTRIEGKKIQFTTGHLRYKLCNHQALTAVKAVHAHDCHDAMHQYVMTNLSLRDTIRRSQEQPLSGWRENRLTAKDRQRGIKDQLCQEDRDTALSSLQSPRSVLFISRSAQNKGKKPNCLKGANLRQQVLSCFILGSGQR